MRNKVYLVAILSALFYGINIPLSKMILKHGINPTILAGFSYFGAGVGFLIFSFLKKIIKKTKMFKNPLQKDDLGFVIAMIFFDVLAIIFLMCGLNVTNSANASLLSNFEIVATSLFAFLFFKEKVSKTMFFAVFLILIASIVLTFEGFDSFKFNFGSCLILLACSCWGMENNCTKKLSAKSADEITLIKGTFSGIVCILISAILNYNFPNFLWIFNIMILGFFSYGLSVATYIYSQKYLGATKTASYFALAPFFGVVLSILLLREIPQIQFYLAFLLMIFGVIFVCVDLKNNA